MRSGFMTIVFVLAALISGAHAAPTEDSVVRIKSGGNRYQSGFVTTINTDRGSKLGVVTALHGILFSRSNPFIVNGHDAYPLTLTWVDVRKDVAFLTIDQSLPLTPLKTTNRTPSAFERILLAGYPFGRPRLLIREKSVPTPSTQTLESFQILKRSIWEERNSPSLQTTVLNIDGNAGPGDSGGPVMTQDNKVIAVINGGFDSGRVDMAWAIPWKEIVFKPVEQESAEIERLRQRANTDKLLFSANPGRVHGDPADLVPCGLEGDACWKAWQDEMKNQLLANESNSKCQGVADRHERGLCEFGVTRDLGNRLASCESAVRLIRKLNDPKYCDKNNLWFTEACQQSMNMLATSANSALRHCNSELFEPEWVQVLLKDAK